MIQNTYKKKFINKWHVFALMVFFNIHGFSQDPYSFSDNIRFEVIIEPDSFLYVDDDNTSGPWIGTETFPFENIPEALAASSTGVTVAVKPGNYPINQNLTVPVDIKLFLFHGDTLEFGTNFNLTINGRIQAFGTSNDSIYFTSTSPVTTWDGIRFINSQLTSELRYCKIDKSVGTDGNKGGGIYTSNSSVKLFGSKLENNNANFGAGIYCENNSAISIEECQIVNNMANINGGGFYGTAMDSLKISNTKFESNTAITSGGGIALLNSPVYLSQSEFIGNDANNGGGIHLNNVTADSTHLSWNTLKSNTASASGGGLYAQNCNLLNGSRNLFQDNSATNGGGIYLNNSQTNFYNNTVFSNTVTNQGGGLFSNGGNNEILNNIIWENTSTDDSQIAGTGINANYNNVEGGFAGTGNVSAYPLFVDTASGNFNLQIKSPCINRGSPANLPDPDTTIADLGIYYYHHHLAAITDQPEDATVNIGNDVSISLQADWGLDYQWEVSTNDGVVWNHVNDPVVYKDITTHTLQLTNVPLSMDGYKYRCKVYGAGTIPLYSNEVYLNVYPVINTFSDTLITCPDIINIPIKINSTQSVELGSISFTLAYNDLSLNYLGYQNLHPQISPAGLIMNAVGGNLYVSWVSLSSATINDGETLFEITFAANPGISDLTWDVLTAGACEYSDTDGFVFISQYTDGLVTTHQDPVIASQPVNASTYEGNNASFSVIGSATGAFYQWQVSNNNGVSWNELENSFLYSGVTTNLLTITNAILILDGYQYRCILSGTCTPAAVSDVAVLTVTTPPQNIMAIAPTSNTCIGDILVPINVTDCNGVGAISLIMSYDEGMLTYNNYQNAHIDLSSGILIVNPYNGKIIISWASITPANIGDDLLLELMFTSIEGSSNLVWDTITSGNCEFSDFDGIPILSHYSNGTVTTSNCATQLDVTVFMEGPFNGTEMDTELNSFLPVIQPYNTSPWNYSGTEDVVPLASGSIVDWGLIELRETTGDASTAIGSTIIASQAVLIRKDGKVKGMDGSNLPNFSETINDNLFVVLRQRNHISIMSANALSIVGSTYTYDFSTSVGQAYGGSLGHKEITTGVWGMMSGDGNADGTIDINDKNDSWIIQSADNGYLMGDFDLNSQVNNNDKNENWLPNMGSGTQVPD